MITLSENLKQRIRAERDKRAAPGLTLRITVDSGGCSGFQYKFSWEVPMPAADDPVYEGMVVTDTVSAPFLNGATVDFVQDLMGSDFKIINPNATSGCGCGQSFAV